MSSIEDPDPSMTAKEREELRAKQREEAIAERKARIFMTSRRTVVQLLLWTIHMCRSLGTWSGKLVYQRTVVYNDDSVMLQLAEIIKDKERSLIKKEAKLKAQVERTIALVNTYQREIFERGVAQLLPNVICLPIIEIIFQSRLKIREMLLFLGHERVDPHTGFVVPGDISREQKINLHEHLCHYIFDGTENASLLNIRKELKICWNIFEAVIKDWPKMIREIVPNMSNEKICYKTAATMEKLFKISKVLHKIFDLIFNCRCCHHRVLSRHNTPQEQYLAAMSTNITLNASILGWTQSLASANFVYGHVKSTLRLNELDIQVMIRPNGNKNEVQLHGGDNTASTESEIDKWLSTGCPKTIPKQPRSHL